MKIKSEQMAGETSSNSEAPRHSPQDPMFLDRKMQKGRALVTIRDDLGNPVPSAVVTGTFSGDFSETLAATTDSNGLATFTTTEAGRRVSFGFCVDNVDGPLPYHPNDNVETCDSY